MGIWKTTERLRWVSQDMSLGAPEFAFSLMGPLLSCLCLLVCLVFSLLFSFLSYKMQSLLLVSLELLGGLER